MAPSMMLTATAPSFVPAGDVSTRVETRGWYELADLSPHERAMFSWWWHDVQGNTILIRRTLSQKMRIFKHAYLTPVQRSEIVNGPFETNLADLWARPLFNLQAFINNINGGQDTSPPPPPPPLRLAKLLEGSVPDTPDESGEEKPWPGVIGGP